MKYEKLTEYLFYLFIFLLPWQTVFILREPMIGGEKWQYGTIGIYLTDIILFAWLVAALAVSIKQQALSNKPIQKNYKFNKNLYLRLLLATCYLLLTWSFLSILWSPDKTLAFYFSLKLLLGAGLFLALQNIKINWRKVIFIFLMAAVLQSVLAIGQFAFQSSFSSKWLGMNNYESWQGGVSVLENEEGRWLRAYGSLPHPNILGGYSVLAFIIGLYFLLSNYKDGVNYENARAIKKQANLQSSIFQPKADQPLAGNFQSIFNDIISKGRKFNLPLWKRGRASEAKLGDLKTNGNLAKLFILASLLIILLGILLTFSRSAWLALAVGIIFLGVIVYSRAVRSESELSAGKKFAKLLLIFGLAGIVFISINHENFLTRFDAGKRLEHKSISERSLYFNQSKEIIRESFWLGTGAGNYTRVVFQKEEAQKPIWQYQPVHNVFMLIWAELGIVGLILFLVILILFLIKSNPQLYFILYTLYFILLFDHWLWTTHFGILLFWLVAGLAVSPKPKR